MEKIVRFSYADTYCRIHATAVFFAFNWSTGERSSNNFITFTLKYSELLRILKRDGWLEIRQSGSHVIMQHPQRSTQLTVPNHGSKEIGKGLQQKILKQAGIKRKGI